MVFLPSELSITQKEIQHNDSAISAFLHIESIYRGGIEAPESNKGTFSLLLYGLSDLSKRIVSSLIEV